MTKQRETFDEVAALYDEVRPQVPDPVVEALWARLALAPGDAVLEVGCGTGQLTKHLLAHGARVVALEPGAALARICRAQLDPTGLEVMESTLEALDPGGTRYAAIAAVQAAHWIAPETFLGQADAALVGDGRIGLVWHLDVSAHTDFWNATQPLYDRYLPDASTKPPRTIPQHVAAYGAALASDPRFAPRPLERWPWTRTFDEPTYTKLLMTHSPVRLLPAADREAFVEGHAEVVRRFGGRIDRHFESVLLAARRCST